MDRRGRIQTSERMRNPWIKKNPLMSMWLSGANAVMGSARGRSTAEAKRQATAMVAEGTKHGRYKADVQIVDQRADGPNTSE